MKRNIIYLLFFALLVYSQLAHAQPDPKRRTISLNGTWEIAEGSMDQAPGTFTSKVEVPGLVNLAVPGFKDVAPKVKNRTSLDQSDPLRQAFWYKRTFDISDPTPDVVMLKVSKAQYGSKVFINGKVAGENSACFTPGFYNIKDLLVKGTNEIVIRVGSSRDAVRHYVPDGFDFEKERYIPGIYDNVTLILCGSDYINSVQAVPDIVNKTIGAQVKISNPKKESLNLAFIVREFKSGKIVGHLQKTTGPDDTGTYVSIPISNCRLWSPEDPFLYTVEVSSDNDAVTTRFGMRKFYFDPLTNRAMLNCKPYFMRGSNITLYRFFEDSLCGNLPWKTVWVKSLFKSFKQFHWNSFRFCIGQPPQEWYDIADEEGFLIQDEFPIWCGGYADDGNNWPKEITVDELAKEGAAWMKENWNHPCVALWDISNETTGSTADADEPGQAVWRIRSLDLSNRPWDNSYNWRRAPGDVFESHPYHFSNRNFKLKDMAQADSIPQGNRLKTVNYGLYPVIINEYGWLWLNRDGTPTRLTRVQYENLLGPNSTTDQRRHLYYTYMAAETEFWRCYRKAAGVMIFTALGYSRPDGQTSDFFTNPATLEYNKECLQYLPDAFSPVALMLDEWGTAIKTGKPHQFRILTINDLGNTWKGTISLKLLKDNKVISETSQRHTIAGFGRKDVRITCLAPKTPGNYTVFAILKQADGKTIKSRRENIPFN